MSTTYESLLFTYRMRRGRVFAEAAVLTRMGKRMPTMTPAIVEWGHAAEAVVAWEWQRDRILSEQREDPDCKSCKTPEQKKRLVAKRAELLREAVEKIETEKERVLRTSTVINAYFGARRARSTIDA